MNTRKRIALVAHDNRKADLMEWVEWNASILAGQALVSTATTGKLIEVALAARTDPTDLLAPWPPITKLKSGPLGGDQQLGALIAEGQIDAIIFFWDPMEPQPHDADVKALLRIAVVYNVPIACNRSTADFLISSPLLNEPYRPVLKDWSEYLRRETG